MSKDSTESYAGSPKMWKDRGIPGVRALAQNIADAQESGVLFFLAVEIELLLEQYFKQNGLPPTPVDLEGIIAQAAQAMIGH